MIVVAGFPMDLAISEEHKLPSEATSYPVESGADVTDHIRNLPEEVTLECVVSDSPIGEIATHPTRQGGGPEAPLPSAEALAKLREIRAARRPVTIETSLGVYENMALVDISIPRSKSTDGGLFFTVRFQRVEIVTNRRTRVRVQSDMAGAGGKAAAKKKPIEEMQVSQRYIWRQRNPPGTGRRTGDFVEVVLVTDGSRPAFEQGKQVSSQTGLGRLFTGIWRYGDPQLASPRLKGKREGQRLTNSDVVAWDADREADIREERDRRRRIIRSGGNVTRSIKDLPPGMSRSALKFPVPQTPTTPTPPTPIR